MDGLLNEPSKVVGWQYGVNQPIMHNPDGSFSTERTITVTDPRLYDGRPTNIPSLWGGRELGEEDAVLMALVSGRDFPNFETVDQAETYARDHSKRIGGLLGAMYR